MEKVVKIVASSFPAIQALAVLPRLTPKGNTEDWSLLIREVARQTLVCAFPNDTFSSTSAFQRRWTTTTTWIQTPRSTAGSTLASEMADFTASPVTAGQLTTNPAQATPPPATVTTSTAKTTTSTSVDTANTSLFQCGSCKRQYKRLDHLARHVRSRKLVHLVLRSHLPLLLLAPSR